MIHLELPTCISQHSKKTKLIIEVKVGLQKVQMFYESYANVYGISMGRQLFTTGNVHMIIHAVAITLDNCAMPYFSALA
jgi:hypothetical protein